MEFQERMELMGCQDTMVWMDSLELMACLDQRESVDQQEVMARMVHQAYQV